MGIKIGISYNYLKPRLLIFLTLLYFIIIVTLDRIGFFYITPPKVGNVEIIGKVISYPENKTNRTEFIIKTDKINNKKVKMKLLCRYYTPENNLCLFDFVLLRGKLSPLAESSNPGVFNYKKYLYRQNVSGMINTNEIYLLDRTKSAGYIIYKIRESMLKVMKDNLPDRTSSIMAKMFLGEKAYITRELKEIFTNAGVMHILVVSGLNIGYVVAIFYFLFRFLPLSNRLRILLLVFPVIMYCLLTGAEAPITRATIMTLTIIVCYFLGRERSVYHAFALSALVITIFNPQAIFSASMQLSYAACLGIVYISPKLIKIVSCKLEIIDSKQTIGKRILYCLQFIIYYIIILFFVSLSAQLATAPLVAYYFYKFSLAGLISNIIVVPLGGILLALCFLLFGVNLLIPVITPVITWLCHFTTNIFLGLVSIFAKLPYSVVITGQLHIIFLIGYYILLIIIFKLKKNLYRIIVICSIVLLFLCYKLVNYLCSPALSVTFLNVGCGETIFIKGPSKENVLINCGGTEFNIGEYVLSPFLWSVGVTKIDKIFITSPKWVYYSGLETIVKNFAVKEIFFSDIPDDIKLLNLVTTTGNTNVGMINFTTSINLKGVKYEIFPYTSTDLSRGLNSYFVKTTYGVFSILFTSDISYQELCKYAKSIGRVDILQVPQQGRKITEEQLLSLQKAFKAKYMVISTEKANFLCKKFTQLLTTAENGAISITTDGRKYKIKPYKKTL